MTGPVTNLEQQSAQGGNGVFQVHEWAQARELHRQGVSKRVISRRLGMTRNTVARLVASDEPPRSALLRDAGAAAL